MSVFQKYYYSGSHFNVNAQTVGETLEKIREKRGAVNAEIVVEEAKPESSPIHNLFPWDDAKAAHLYRLERARSVIRHIHILKDENEPAKAENLVKAYVAIPQETEMRNYVPVQVALQTQETREYVIANARKELESFQKKYNDILELAEVIKVIERFLANAS